LSSGKGRVLVTPSSGRNLYSTPLASFSAAAAG
jgi:hypothetical protein